MSEHGAFDLTSSFPKALKQDLQIVQARLVPFSPASGEFAVNLSSGPVSIPYRLYLNEPATAQLTATQRVILDCLYTRHCDGHVREKHLKELLGEHAEWVCPYVWALLGEYVIEIVDLIRAHAHQLDRRRYSDFLRRNPEFFERTRQRAASYWDCYYRGRGLKNFEQYPSCAVFSMFGLRAEEKVG
jgi:hypothetical protein